MKQEELKGLLHEDVLLIGRADIVAAQISDLYMAIGNKMSDLEEKTE